MSENDFGYGQQDPTDSTDEFNKVSFLVRQMMAKQSTMKLCQVVAVHGGGLAQAGTVDVTLLVNQIDGNGNAVEHGTVYGLPYSRLQGGASAIVCDPAVDDVGYIVAADRDTSKVRSTLARANPGSLRKFDVADSVYCGAVLAQTPDQYVLLNADGIRIVDKNGNSAVFAQGGVTVIDDNGNALRMTASGTSLDDCNSNHVTLAAAGVTVSDHFGNSAVTSSIGVTITDKSGNVAAMTASGVAVTSVGNLTLTDAHSNVLSSGAGGWTATPASGHPFTVAGSLVVQNDLQLGGGFLAVGGGTYTGALQVTGEVVAKFGTANSVGLTTHTHSQPADSHGDIEAQTLAPTHPS